MNHEPELAIKGECLCEDCANTMSQKFVDKFNNGAKIVRNKAIPVIEDGMASALGFSLRVWDKAQKKREFLHSGSLNYGSGALFL